MTANERIVLIMALRQCVKEQSAYIPAVVMDYIAKAAPRMSGDDLDVLLLECEKLLRDGGDEDRGLRLLARKLREAMAGITEKEQGLMRKLYERYQLHWMMHHGASLENFLGSFLGYMADSDDFSFLPSTYMSGLANWELDCGFGGSCYVCFDEFRETDMLEKEYVLPNLVQDGEEGTYLALLEKLKRLKEEGEAN